MNGSIAEIVRRSGTNVGSSLPAIDCTTARRRSELALAFRLIYERYHREGLTEWSPHGLRVLPHQLLDTTWVIIARRGRRLRGTLSLIEDGAMGVPIEKLYPAEIWRLRREQKRVAELACFALADRVRGESMPVLKALLRMACGVAAARGIDELVICVHPRRATFYERRLGFAELGPTRACPWVCDQPAVAMRLAVAARRDDGKLAPGDSTNPSVVASLPGDLKRADRAYFLRLLDSQLAPAAPLRNAA